MTNGFNKSMRKHLSIEFQKLRAEFNLSIPEIALKCNLSSEDIERIEKGNALCYEKYKSLAFYYKKKIQITLADL